MSMHAIGSMIRKYREDHEVPLREMAPHLRLSQQALCAIEQGHRLPSLATLAQIGRVFRLTAEQIGHFVLSTPDIPRPGPRGAR